MIIWMSNTYSNKNSNHRIEGQNIRKLCQAPLSFCPASPPPSFWLSSFNSYKHVQCQDQVSVEQSWVISLIGDHQKHRTQATLRTMYLSQSWYGCGIKIITILWINGHAYTTWVVFKSMHHPLRIALIETSHTNHQQNDVQLLKVTTKKISKRKKGETPSIVIVIDESSYYQFRCETAWNK